MRFVYLNLLFVYISRITRYACESGKVIWIINDFLPPLVCMCAGNVLQRALVYDDVL